MDDNKYLNEKEYQKNVKLLKVLGVIVMIIGIIMIGISVFLLFKGFLGSGKVFDMHDGVDIQYQSKVAFDGFSLFAIGGFGLIISLGITGFGWRILIIAHRREIMAFRVQQAMPIVQEGVEKMAPSVGKVAKEVKKGINEADNESEK